MIAKCVAAVLAGALALLAAGPAGAMRSPDPPVEDPSATLDDVTGGLDENRSNVGSVTVGGRRGTASSTAVGVGVTGGADPDGAGPRLPDLDVRAVDTKVITTTDHERLGLSHNVSRGEASVGSMFLRGSVAEEAHPERPALVPTERWYGESFQGKNSQRYWYCADPAPTSCESDQMVQFPTEESSFENVFDTGGVYHQLAGVASLLDGLANYANGKAGGVLPTSNVADVVRGLPEESQQITADAGSVLDALLRPASIDTNMAEAGGTASLESKVKSLDLLGRLTRIEDAGPGEQTSSVSDDVAEAGTKLFNVKHMQVLNVDALMNLWGIDLDLLPLPALAEMADALGIDVVKLASEVPGISSWQSIKEFTLAVINLQDSVTEFVASGECDDLDELLRTEYNMSLRASAKAVGLDPPDCLGAVDALEAFQAAIETLIDDLRSALLSSVENEGLVTVTNLSAGVSARAGIRRDGDHVVGASTWGSIQRIKAGSTAGSLDVRGTVDAWNTTETVLNDGLNETLGSLFGPPFQDLVRIRLMPELVEKGEIVDDYVQSTASMSLLQVYVDMPTTAEAEAAVARFLADSGSPSVPGGSGGGGGGGDLLGRVAQEELGEPLVFNVAHLTATARHRDPGFVPTCAAAEQVCDLSTHLNRSWTPDQGWKGAPTGSSTNEDNLPRTGAASGTVPIALTTGLAALAMTLRRLSMRSALSETLDSPMEGPHR